LERHIAVNSELRARHAQDPQKFILSEADLDADIRALSVVSEHPDLYAHVVELGCLGQLVGLLSHENTDISIGSIVIIAELTDDDTSANNEQWQGLAEAMLNADLIGLLLSNFDRFDERDEADRTGLYSGLSILENLCSQRSTCEYLAQHDDLLRWLLKRIQRPEDTVSQNTQYAAEVLALMAQSSERSCNHLIKIDAIDQLLQLVAPYRKHAPFKNGDEAEYVENLFETLVCLVDRPDGNVKFVDAEGLELCLIMLKEGGVCKQPALRLLDHAIGGVSAGHVSQRLVQAGGLKVIFTAFMKRDDGRTMPHILAVMASLLRLLPADSAERIRTLAKFVERDYEKLRKLIRLRRFYATKLADNEKHIEAERRTRLHAQNEFGALDSAADLEPEMLHAGLFPLQMINVLLAWLTVEDDGACCMIQEFLVPQEQGQGQALNSIKSSLISQVEALISNGQDRTEMKDMLAALIECMPS
jgi:beta-catenin-like protein 1